MIQISFKRPIQLINGVAFLVLKYVLQLFQSALRTFATNALERM